MIVDARNVSGDAKYECDICILGGGVAGLVLASELKGLDCSVIVVEAGGAQFSMELQDSCAPEVMPPILPDPTFSRLKFLGGSSNHWQNNTSPYSEIDFEKRDWIPDSGWPIEFGDIEPYYSGAAKYCGVGSDGYNSKKWLSTLNRQNIVGGAIALEPRVSKFSNPPVRFFSKYGDSISSGDNITILKNASVVDLDFEAATKRLNSVKCSNGAGGTIRISSKKFVMCFGGIENARMLLAFNEKYDNELGNQGDSVGRYFMEHPTPRAAQLFTDNPEIIDEFEKRSNLGEKDVSFFLTLSEQALRENQTTNLRIPFQPVTKYDLSDAISSFHIMADSLGDGDVPDYLAEHISNMVFNIEEIAEAVARKQWNTKLLDSMSKFGGFQMPMMMEQTPHRDNRVRLGAKKDKFGLKRIILDWELKREDKDRVWKSLELVARDIGALSIGRLQLLKERESRIWDTMLGFSNHHMGTTRMSESPKDGVVDRDLRVFGTSNLFVAGSSVFSTGSHVPPTLTIAAFSIRLAKYLIDEVNGCDYG